MIATLTSWKEQNYGGNQPLTQEKAQKYHTVAYPQSFSRFKPFHPGFVTFPSGKHE